MFLIFLFFIRTLFFGTIINNLYLRILFNRTKIFQILQLIKLKERSCVILFYNNKRKIFITATIIEKRNLSYEWQIVVLYEFFKLISLSTKINQFKRKRMSFKSLYLRTISITFTQTNILKIFVYILHLPTISLI